MPRLPDENDDPDVLGDGLEAAYPGLYVMTPEDVERWPDIPDEEDEDR